VSFPISVALPPWYPVTTKLGFDEVYLINLNRRPERLRKMEEILHLVGIRFNRIEAVDGQNLTQAQLSSMEFMPGYLDPFHKRPMKLGEIGCFLSHYKVWEDITHNEHQRSIVLEDDVRFTQNGTLMFVLNIQPHF
jgi:collagen beta-1,O-galactosyltransferase